MGSAIQKIINDLGFTAENVANKDTDNTLSANSDTKYSSQKATKDHVINELSPISTELTEVSDKVTTNQDNISLNAFRTAINGSLAQFGMVDGIIDEYEDENGIDIVLEQPFAHMLMENNTDIGSGANAVTDVGTPTFTSATGSSQPTLNNALTLDGSTDALNLDDFATDVASDTTGTIAFWFKANNFSSTKYLFSIGDTDGLPLYAINISPSGKISVLQNPADFTLQIDDALLVSTWYHVVVVQDGVEAVIYINGVAVAQTFTEEPGGRDTWFAQQPNLDNARIGCRNFNNGGNSNFTDGQIDDWRYYSNKALTSDEIALIYNSGAGSELGAFGNSVNISYDSVNDLYSPSGDSITVSPFAHMALENNTDDGTGANAVTDIGTPTYTAPTGASQPTLNNALTLDGSTDALNLDALNSDILSDTTGSFSFWINKDAFASTGVIVGFGDTNVQEFIRIRVTTSGKLQVSLFIATVKKWEHESSASISTGTWYHVVIVQDGVSPKIYLDTVDITNLIDTSDTTVWFSDFSGLDNGRLGCTNQNSAGNHQFFDGQIDDFRYYSNKVLTTAEVALLYNSGAGTEADQPKGTRDNMTLQSNSFPAQAQADNARIVLLQEDVDSITLNTDLIASVSRDGGITFSSITLVNQGEYDTGRNLLSASVDISSQPAGTDMVYKLETANNKDLKIHGSGLSWD